MENLINIVTNRLAQSEQKRDRDAIEETTLQRISRETALEINALYYSAHDWPNVNALASIVYTHFRKGKEL